MDFARSQPDCRILLCSLFTELFVWRHSYVTWAFWYELCILPRWINEAPSHMNILEFYSEMHSSLWLFSFRFIGIIDFAILSQDEIHKDEQWDEKSAKCHQLFAATYSRSIHRMESESDGMKRSEQWNSWAQSSMKLVKNVSRESASISMRWK